ncbi:MAG: right-handed parallel beta-helix repeat-containing protein, partial [Actinobacteria bacterium]|nr:right-handed parallel beta-helix repeat-containing protein [Actinomycetota bacterium]
MMHNRRSLAALILVFFAGFLPFRAPATTTTTVAPPSGIAAPASPPAQICGNPSVLNGPATAPPGAVTVPAGDNNAFFDNEKFSGVSGRTYWFEPGTHTLGTSEWGQIEARPNSTYIGAPGAILDGRGVNRYAFTGGHTGVTLKHLTVRNFVAPSNEGTINGGAATGWTITNNTIENNGGAGVFTGDNVLIQDNCITRNGAHGVSGFKKAVAVGYGASAINNVTVTRNEISEHPRDTSLERNPDGTDTGCGCTGGAKFWDTKGGVVTDNWVHHNQSPGLWADTNNVDFLFEGNYLSDNGAEAIWYEISYNATIRNNTLVRNTWEKGARRAGGSFPDNPIYIAESGGDSRVSPNRTTLEITGNYLEDNWGGVALWEAAERFCASPANTSSSYCTKVNPAIDHTACSDMNLIKSEPYYSDCRWKTQNVLVSGNTFKLNKANLPRSCTGSPNCGHPGVFGNYGTDYPAGTPYK